MWLVYALGGGWGHLTRAVALARAAGRDRDVRILTNSPYAGIVHSHVPELDIAIIESRGQVLAELSGCRASTLIVDTFPRGLGGELVHALHEARANRVLIHRDLNPRYVDAFGLRAFTAAHYQLVIVPGAGEGAQLGDLPVACETAPWLVSSSEFAMPGEQGRATLRLPTEEWRVAIVCASGKAEELQWYGSVVKHLHSVATVRCIAAERPPDCPEECWVQHWPAMDLYGVASVVVGGCGYNTAQECAAWGVPLVARAWPRKYDRQALRAARSRGTVTLVEDPEEAAREALKHIRAAATRAPVAATFSNGAVEAVQRIAAL